MWLWFHVKGGSERIMHKHTHTHTFVCGRASWKIKLLHFFVEKIKQINEYKTIAFARTFQRNEIRSFLDLSVHVLVLHSPFWLFTHEIHDSAVNFSMRWVQFWLLSLSLSFPYFKLRMIRGKAMMFKANKWLSIHTQTLIL